MLEGPRRIDARVLRPREAPWSLLGLLGRRGALVLCLVLWGAGLPPLGEAALSARALVDRTRIAPEDVLGLTVVVSGGEAEEVDTSAIGDFEVSSRGRSSSLQIVNTRVSRETRFHYALVPRRTGTLVIPPLTVRGGGEQATTEPIEVVVAEASEGGGDRPVTLRGEVSNPAPFVGEEIVYTLRVEAAVPLYDASYREPSFDGFLVHKVDGQRTGTEVRNGREIHVTELTYLLTPRQDGRLAVGSATLTCQVPAPGEPGRPGALDRFADPFFRRRRVVERIVRSPEVPVEVRPLPPAPEGTPFSGLVGDFTLSASLAPTEVAAGESVTLTLTLEGQGNVEEAPAPEVEPPSGFKRYPDNPETEVRATPEGTRGTKRFRFALVPTAPGTYAVGPFRLLAFDPVAGAYRTLEAGPLPVRVTPAAAPAVGSVPSGRAPSPEPVLGLGRRVEQRGEDILDLHRDLGAVESVPTLGGLALAGLFAAPPLGYLLAWAATAARRRERTLTEHMRQRARRFLAEAAAARKGGDPRAALGGLQRAVTAAVLGAVGRPGEVLTYEEAQALLDGAGVDPALAREAVELLRRLDAARYGGELGEAELGGLADRCGAFVAALGRRGGES
ncbi:MAG: hypothetical protein Kow0092_02250 [Deferrisomatales bacterium]